MAWWPCGGGQGGHGSLGGRLVVAAVNQKITKGWGVGRLLRYLMGPGRANEHVHQRVVASWDKRPERHQPPPRAARGDEGCAFDVRALAEDLNVAAVAGGVPLRKPNLVSRGKEVVWHCSLRNHERDRILSDAEWAEVAAQVMDRTGIAPRGDCGGCRWVAIRHAEDHIHIAAVLVRQDTGERITPWNDWPKTRDVCREAEVRLQITRTAAPDRTALKAASRAEEEKAKLRRQREGVDSGALAPGGTPRTWLRRTVREAAVAAHDLDSFDAALADRGVILECRNHPETGEAVGVKFGAPGDENAEGLQVWFSGSTLGPDLSLPKLRERWANAPVKPLEMEQGRRPKISREGVKTAVEEAEAAMRHATEALHAAHVAREQGRQWAGEPLEGIVHAAEDILIAATAATGEYRKGQTPPEGPEDRYARAALQPEVGQPRQWGQIAADLRSCARSLLAVGRRVNTAGPEGSTAALLIALMALVAEIAAYHQQRQHDHQHRAATLAYEELKQRRPAGREHSSGPPGRLGDARHPENIRTAAQAPKQGRPAQSRPAPQPPVPALRPPGFGPRRPGPRR
jgi:hypothetical protein